MIHLEVGKKVTAVVQGYNHRGEGVCRVSGFTVFVPFVIMGEKLEMEIVTLKKNYGVGSVTKMIESSPDRISPRCPIFGICGGCQLQHIEYHRQSLIKMQIIEDALARIGGIQEKSVIQPIIMAEHPWYYRNKAQMPVASTAGRTVMGFYRQGTHDIVETPECFIQQQKNNEALGMIKELLQKIPVEPYDEKTEKGQIRHIVVRHSASSKATMVVIVSKDLDFKGRDPLIERMKEKMPDLKSLYQNIQPERSNVILGKESVLLFGEKTIQDQVGPFYYDLSPQSFFQVNPEQTEKIYDMVTKFAEPSDSDIIVDAYCGIGTISLYLAQKAKYVHGIEIVSEAIRDAKKNTRKNRVTNAEFHLGKVEDILPKLKSAGVNPKTVVIDPPRKGCEPSVIEVLAEMKVERVIYVSCSPASLARDLRLFADRGYVIRKVQPVDQFPHTAHVETVVLMCASSEAGKC